METTILSINHEKARKILSREILFDELIELTPDQYPKGAEKKASGDCWSLWVKDDLNYAVVLGLGVFLVLQ